MSALRFSVPGQPTRLIEQRDPYWDLTQRQRRILDMVRGHRGNRSRAARDLGITPQTVETALRAATAAGCRVPPPPRFGAGRGPDLRPRKGTPVPCGAVMPRSGDTCARGVGHRGGHRTLAAERRERRAQSLFEHTGRRAGDRRCATGGRVA